MTAIVAAIAGLVAAVILAAAAWIAFAWSVVTLLEMVHGG